MRWHILLVTFWDERNANWRKIDVEERVHVRSCWLSWSERGSESYVGADGVWHGSDGYGVQGVSGRKCILGMLSRAKLAALKIWALVPDWLWIDVVAVNAVNWAITTLPIFALPSSEGIIRRHCLAGKGFLNPAIHLSPSSYTGTCRVDWSRPFSSKLSPSLPATKHVFHTLWKRPDRFRF